MAVSVLKNLLIKHAMDDRYTAFKVRAMMGEGGITAGIKVKEVRHT